MDVESTSELDSKGASTHMGPNGPNSKLIYHVDILWGIGFTLSSLLCIRAFW